MAVLAVRFLLLSFVALAPAVALRAQTAPASHFRVGHDCALCHSVAAGANAMRTSTGDDVSPHGLWQATMMANSFRDPYFRAQLEKETAAKGEKVQQLCLRCHVPMAHHDAVMGGKDAPVVADVADDELAHDGVSCTVCHQITPDGLGGERTWSGRPVIGTERRIFGPFADPATGPMRMHVGYTPTESAHVRKSALCATCHTLFTEHHGTPFPEQTPYLEWRNSAFSDEAGATDTSRTCQQCHMPVVARTRIARNPMGRDFLIPVRDGFAAHTFVGGNAFMVDLLRSNREELGVEADVSALARTAAAARRQLAEDTAKVTVEGLEQKEGHASFSVHVENLTGHRFPTGYPARRAWLRVQVRRGQKVVFDGGAFDDKGRLVDVADPLAQDHVTVVETKEQVPVYEMVVEDPDGTPTTSLTAMVKKRKDNRLLPKGWRRDGPHAAETAPIGTGNDVDFTAGGDTVQYRVPIGEGGGRLQVVAWLLYQPVPPHWADALRAVDGDRARAFVRMYDAADLTPDTVAVATAIEQ